MSPRLAPPQALKSSQSSRVNEPLNTQRNGNVSVSVFVKGIEEYNPVYPRLLDKAFDMFPSSDRNYAFFDRYSETRRSVPDVFENPRLDLGTPVVFTESGFTNLIIQATNVSGNQSTLNTKVDPKETLGLMSRFLPEAQKALQESGTTPVLSMQMMYDDSRYSNLDSKGKALVDRFGNELKREDRKSNLLDFGHYMPPGNKDIPMMMANPKNPDDSKQNDEAIKEGFTLFKNMIDKTLED
jgi:hypothetical protein